MDKQTERIVEGIAHAKDAKAVLSHIDLKADTPAEAGARAEILAAEEMLAKGIEKLKSVRDDAGKQAK